MSIKRFLLGNDCDGDSGRCLADMVHDEEGDYVLYADHAAEVERLQERDAEWGRKASAWIASPEAAQRLDGYRELAQKLNAAEAERDALLERADRAEAHVKHFNAMGWICPHGDPDYPNTQCDTVTRLEAEVERLRAEKDAVKIAAWDKSSEQLREVVRLTQLLANVFDNLNDLPISDEWARLTCDRISAALGGE
jgi:mannitol/fructose-specific phosphotransferase system IIA component (Ntr-type)